MPTECRRVTRRKFVTLTAGAVVAAPFLNFGNYQLFAASPTRYSDRAVTLVNESLVVDMLSLC